VHSLQAVSYFVLFSGDRSSVKDSPKDRVQIEFYRVCESKAHCKKAHRNAQNKGMEKNVFLINKFKTRNF
jgi:hypothetical protein